MTGQRIYELYANEAADLPKFLTKGEALPAWPFLQDEVKAMWTAIGANVGPKAAK